MSDVSLFKERHSASLETPGDSGSLLPPFFEAFHQEDILEILSGWMEVIACSRDNLYEDWRKRSEAFAFCKALEALLLGLSPRELQGDSDQLREPGGYYLNARQLEQLEQASRIITSSVPASRIICFGARTRGLDWDNCWVAGHQESREYFFYVLVLTGETEKRPTHEVQDLLESRCRSFCRLMALVHPLRLARIRAQEGDRFFWTVLQRGIHLHGGQDEIPDPCLAEASCSPWEKSPESWERWSRASEGFLRGSLFYLEAAEYRLAVFLLHQAVEAICIGLIQALTGYRINTHNLDRLLRFTLQFTESLWGVFPRDSPEEIQWFLKLQKAYTHARYREEYRITVEEALVLSSRVRRIRQLAREVYLQSGARDPEPEASGSRSV